MPPKLTAPWVAQLKPYLETLVASGGSYPSGKEAIASLRQELDVPKSVTDAALCNRVNNHRAEVESMQPSVATADGYLPATSLGAPNLATLAHQQDTAERLLPSDDGLALLAAQHMSCDPSLLNRREMAVRIAERMSCLGHGTSVWSLASYAKKTEFLDMPQCALINTAFMTAYIDLFELDEDGLWHSKLPQAR